MKHQDADWDRTWSLAALEAQDPLDLHISINVCGRALQAAAAKKAEVGSSSGRHTISLQEQFYARPSDLFDCFTDPQRIMGYTQSPAQARILFHSLHQHPRPSTCTFI